MDFTSIIGTVGGIAFVLFGIFSSGNLGNFIDPASILIVVGGTICAIVASFPFRMLKNVGKHMAIIMKPKGTDVEGAIDTMVEFAQIARREGLLALEQKAQELEDPFFRKGIMYVVDAMDADSIRFVLEQDIENMSLRHDEEAEIYIRGGDYAPAFGMIGTLVGLINMLRSMNLDSGASDELGSSMSVALVTTFYGCLLSNLLFKPIASKLALRNAEERLYKEIIVEGVIGIQAGNNPKNLKEHLASSLSQKKQTLLMNTEGDAGGDKKKKVKKEKKPKK